jgi:hypothetical protein
MTIPPGLLVRVVAPHFVAGLIVDPDTDRVVYAAPILAWAKGMHRDGLRQSFIRRGWRASVVPDLAP